MKNLAISAALVASLGLLSAGVANASGTAGSYAGAEIVSALSISNNVGLEFGQIVPTIVIAFASPDVMSGRASIDETLALIQFQSFLDRLSPNTLFGEAVIGLLNPETRTLGPIIQSQMYGAIMGAPLPFGQSLLLIWPQITGLIAGMIVVFAAAYIIFQREEVRA